MGTSRQNVDYHLKATNTKPAPGRRIMPSDAEIIALHQQGLTSGDIAQELGISICTVSLTRKRLGVKGRGVAPILSPTEVERVLALARQGMRQADIAAECGVSQVTVSKTCISHGIRRHNVRSRRAKT